MTRSFTAVAMIAAALLATAGFIALGAIFDYPAILDQPAADVLAQFAAHHTAVMFGSACSRSRRPCWPRSPWALLDSARTDSG